MAVKIQFRRDTAANWTAVATTILSSGEVGYESDTGNIKVGDGTTQWGSLPYYQLPNVSVNPATSTDLNNALYRVMGRYRLNSVTAGSTFTNAPSDLDAADADSYCAMIVTSHAYSALSTLIQQTLTQFSGSGTTLKQWVRMYDGTNWTAWTSTAHLTDNEVTDAKLRDSGALSVIGRSANSSGDPADIATTASSNAVLRESGGVLGFGQVATANIANAAVTTAKIAASAVTATELASDAVTTAKILNANVTTAKIATSAVTANELASDAVTTAKILNANVTAAKIAASTIMPYPTSLGNGSGGVGAFCVLRTSSATATMTCNALSGLTLTGTWFFFGVKFGGGGAYLGASGDVIAFVGTGSSTGFNTLSAERVAGWGIRIS